MRSRRSLGSLSTPEFVEQTLPEVKEQAEAEEAQRHVVDEVGAKTHDQVGTSYAPKGETPMLAVPVFSFLINRPWNCEGAYTV